MRDVKWPSRERLAQVGYGVAAWLVMGAVAVPCWLLVLALPKLTWRWRATWGAARLLSLALGISLEVRGQLPARRTPCIIVANHASIIDSFVLCAIFADPVVFVAGGDLARHRITGPFLRRLGSVFVRTEAGPGRSSVRAALTELEEAARGGDVWSFSPRAVSAPSRECDGSSSEPSWWPARLASRWCRSRSSAPARSSRPMLACPGVATWRCESGRQLIRRSRGGRRLATSPARPGAQSRRC